MRCSLRTVVSFPVDELARRQGVRPVESIDDMARPDIFESDEELGEFLAHVYASRRADVLHDGSGRS